jgi:serine/threonine-protein kinase
MTTKRTTPVPGLDRMATAQTCVAPEDAVAGTDGATGAVAGERLGPEAWVGRVIDDRYRIVRAIGEGGMGAVFVAEHLKLGSEVALKLVHADLATHEQLAARFAREAMASARLNHPHVASALDYGTLEDGGAYLVMQLARGRSLHALLDERTALPWPMACEIAAQIADAAAAAHALGIVHRDLKPDNVFVEEREDGTVLCQVLDFGIARFAVAEGQAPDAAAPGRSLTTIGTVMGTPGYMAPEQAMGRPADPRADLYALGAVLLEMITGVPLFDGETLTAIVTAQLTGGAPLIAERCAQFGLPQPLEDLLRALLAPEPERRPDRAADVRDELRRVVRAVDPSVLTVRRSGEVPTTPAAGSPGPTLVPTRASAEAALPGEAALPPPHSSPRLPPKATAIAGILLAALLAIGVLGAVRSADEGGDGSGASSSGPALDEEGQRRYGELLGAEEREARRAAATYLLALPAERLPDVARAVSELELARGCRERKDLIVHLGEIGDQSAVPALERLAATPRRGCGFLGTKDCHRCLRADLDGVLAQLRGEAEPP